MTEKLWMQQIILIHLYVTVLHGVEHLYDEMDFKKIGMMHSCK
jgi:hypothetical protein